MSEPQFPDNRLGEPLRQHCLEAVPYHPHSCRFGQWPPILPVQSQLGREGPGVQMFPLQPPRGSSGTSHSTHHRPLLPSPRADQPGPLRQLASCLCPQRQFPTLIRGRRFPTLARGRQFPALA